MGTTGTPEGVEHVRAAVAALNRGDVDAYGAAFHPDCIRWSNDTGMAVPAAEVLETLRQLQAAFTDFRLTDELLFGCGDRVVARWRTRGVHTGEFASIPATGRSIDIRTCEVYELSGDLVVATWSYGDPTAMPRQLGLLDGRA